MLSQTGDNEGSGGVTKQRLGDEKGRCGTAFAEQSVD